jgi:hypothetical protein
VSDINTPDNETDVSVTLSAYGFRLTGVASRYLQPGGDDGPLVTVSRRIDGAASGRPVTTTLALVGGGRLHLDRETLTAEFVTPEPLSDDEVVHPYLAPAAAVMAGWQGWDPFHAGAFARSGAAIAVLGAREQGKSTLLAAMALDGVDVVTDDVLVVDRGAAQVGPRCVDLRVAGVREAFPGAQLDPSRSGARARLRLAALPGPLDLAGWVALEWGDRLELRPLRPSQRLERLARSHSRAGGARDDALLELVRLPGWELVRPRGLERVPDAAGRLLELAAAG